MGGGRGTGGPRTTPCSASWYAGCEIATENLATQKHNVTSEVSREKRRLPGKMLGAALLPTSCPPSHPASHSPTHLWAQSPLQPLTTALNPSHPPLGELRDPKLANLLPPGTCHHPPSPLQSERDFFQHQSFSLERIFQIIVQHRNHLDLTSVRSWDTFLLRTYYMQTTA